jgi:uncharacterized protein (DUF302 family)
MTLKSFSKILTAVALTATLSQSATLTELHGTKGEAGRALTDMVRKLDTIGYSTVGKNEHIEIHYFNKYKEKNLDLLNFYTIVDKESIRELLLSNPDFGAYAPFNLLGFKNLSSSKDGDTTWYGHLDSDTMLDIIGEKDDANRKKFTVMMDKLDDLVMKEMKPTEAKTLTFDAKLPAQPLLKMVKKFGGVDDIEEYVEEFIVAHDTLFGKNEFIIAGFTDFKFEYDDMELDFEKYDAYWVSSLCHFQFSNSVFNHGSPQAAVFAPCSVYFYIPKGKNELHVGYATVENWINTTGIKDKAQLEYMKRIADKVVETFKELGFTMEEGTGGESANVATPRELSSEIAELKAMVKSLAKEVEELKKKEPIEESSPAIKAEVKKPKKVEAVKVVEVVKPANLVELPKKEFKTAKMVIGGDAPINLTAYYASSPQTIETLTYNLRVNGFEILSVNNILKDKIVLSVTNEELKNTNSFISVINILLNGKDEIRVQNPSYFGASYIKDFTYGQFKNTLTSLKKALGEMYVVADVNRFSKLADYNFMFGMPHFTDKIRLSKNDNIENKLTNAKTKDRFAYSLKLPNGSTLVGHKIADNSFLKSVKAGKNAQLLPYQSMVKDGEAYMLDPKYYLALSLPLLTMTDFMKIATAPEEIEKELKKAYK